MVNEYNTTTNVIPFWQLMVWAATAAPGTSPVFDPLPNNELVLTSVPIIPAVDNPISNSSQPVSKTPVPKNTRRVSK
jgi:hypothetical protein